MHFTFILNKRIQVPFQKYKTKFRRHFRNKWLISFDKKASNWLREFLSPYQFSTDSIPRFSSNKKARYLPANIIILKICISKNSSWFPKKFRISESCYHWFAWLRRKIRGDFCNISCRTLLLNRKEFDWKDFQVSLPLALHQSRPLFGLN